MKKQPSQQEVNDALNQLVEEGKLHLIIKGGEPYYIENTFTAGYEHAKREAHQ